MLGLETAGSVLKTARSPLETAGSALDPENLLLVGDVHLLEDDECDDSVRTQSKTFNKK